MPKLSGKELALRLREDHPVLPVVFMSGYAYDAAGGDEPCMRDGVSLDDTDQSVSDA
jgi:FixJ family two-component response regulator